MSGARDRTVSLQSSVLKQLACLALAGAATLVAVSAAVADYSNTPLYTSSDNAIDTFFARNLSSSTKNIGPYAVPVEGGAQAAEYANLIAAHTSDSITALTEVYNASVAARLMPSFGGGAFGAWPLPSTGAMSDGRKLTRTFGGGSLDTQFLHLVGDVGNSEPPATYYVRWATWSAYGSVDCSPFGLTSCWRLVDTGSCSAGGGYWYGTYLASSNHYGSCGSANAATMVSDEAQWASSVAHAVGAHVYHVPTGACGGACPYAWLDPSQDRFAVWLSPAEMGRLIQVDDWETYTNQSIESPNGLPSYAIPTGIGATDFTNARHALDPAYSPVTGLGADAFNHAQDAADYPDDPAYNGPMTSDETINDAAAAVPMTPSGPLAPGSYPTELWNSSEVGNETGLEVVSGADPGTAAVTGAVQDAATGLPLTDATVTMDSGSTTVTTATSASGAFSFSDLPATLYTLTVTAPSYGDYTLLNESLGADEQYEVTANMTASAQSFDEPGPVAQTQEQVNKQPGTAYSSTRVPPSIRVGIYPLQADCSRSSDTLQAVKNYSFDYYVLRVAYQEVNVLHLNETGMKAFLALDQNYGWFHKTSGGTYDIENSTNRQCFRPERFVPRQWHIWLQDVLDERIVSDSGTLLQTNFLAGDPLVECPDPTVPSGYASQYSIQGLSEGTGTCSLQTDWRSIGTYFYPGSQFVNGDVPTVPLGSATVADGQITFTYSSTQYGQNVAWWFSIERQKSDGTWARVGLTKWRSSTRSVQASFTYTPPDGCYRYRVRAGNPVGYSAPGGVVSAKGGYSTSGECKP